MTVLSHRPPAGRSRFTQPSYALAPSAPSSAHCAPARRRPREWREGLRCQLQRRTGEVTSDGGVHCEHARARRPSTSISKQTSGRVRRQLRGRADEATRDDGARYRHEQATRSSTSTSKQTGGAPLSPFSWKPRTLSSSDERRGITHPIPSPRRKY